MAVTQERAMAVAEQSAAIIESVVMQGDLAKLTAPQRVQYYARVCESLGLNPLTRPFDYLSLSGKLVLYAKRDATDQIRASRKVSVSITARERVEDLYIVTARATLTDGRTDESVGAVSIAGLKGDNLANAIMKAETKAKRRVTLSIAGLGWMDESEVSSVADAQRVDVDTETGEVLSALPATASAPAPASTPPQAAKVSSEAQHRKLYAVAGKVRLQPADAKALLQRLYGVASAKDLTSPQASDFIKRLEAVEDGKATLADLTAADAREPGDDAPRDPLDEAVEKASELCRQAGITDPERRTLLDSMQDQASAEKVLAHLREEVAKIPF